MRSVRVGAGLRFCGPTEQMPGRSGVSLAADHPPGRRAEPGPRSTTCTPGGRVPAGRSARSRPRSSRSRNTGSSARRAATRWASADRGVRVEPGRRDEGEHRVRVHRRDEAGGGDAELLRRAPPPPRRRPPGPPPAGPGRGPAPAPASPAPRPRTSPGPPGPARPGRSSRRSRPGTLSRSRRGPAGPAGARWSGRRRDVNAGIAVRPSSPTTVITDMSVALSAPVTHVDVQRDRDHRDHDARCRPARDRPRGVRSVPAACAARAAASAGSAPPSSPKNPGSGIDLGTAGPYPPPEFQSLRRG